jgi:apolipoprotein N-acyltransferase
LFVGSFFVRRGETKARWLWLIFVGLLAGLAFGAKRKPHDPAPRFGFPAVTASVAWVYCLTAYVVLESPGSSREWMVLTWPVPVALGLLGRLVAASRRGRYRELVVLANAACLLVFALTLDHVLVPRSHQ